MSAVADQDWVRATQAQFVPFADRTTAVDRADVVRAARSRSDQRRRSIPGLAFGTGSHPTTRLCLEWLARELPRGATVLDYGCGSGILAIAAAKLGAGDVIGVDIDPQAVEASARECAAQSRRGDLHACRRARRRRAHVRCRRRQHPRQSVALARAGALPRASREGGRIVLSGVLEARPTAVDRGVRAVV